MEESRIFRILKFAEEKEFAGETFSAKDLTSATGVPWKVARNYAFRLATANEWRDGIFGVEDGSPLLRGQKQEKEFSDSYRITYPAMMNWREYQELTESRASSLSAQRNAVTSIRIAIGAIAVSSVFAVIQLFLVLTTSHP